MKTKNFEIISLTLKEVSFWYKDPRNVITYSLVERHPLEDDGCFFSCIFLGSGAYEVRREAKETSRPKKRFEREEDAERYMMEAVIYELASAGVVPCRFINARRPILALIELRDC